MPDAPVGGATHNGPPSPSIVQSGELTDNDEKLFKIALNTRNLEISLFWQRSNYFLVLNSGLAVGFFSLKNQAYALVLASLGTLTALLWFLVNLGSKYWQSRWEHELTLRERKLYPNDPLFAATREQTDSYVRESLRYHEHRGLQHLLDGCVMWKPSVSFMMTVLSLGFLLVWVGLLVERCYQVFGSRLHLPWHF